MSLPAHVAIFNAEMRAYCSSFGFPDLIITGGATGADTLARNWANSRGIPYKEFRPDYTAHEPHVAPLVRNQEMADMATHFIAFPNDRRGSGTQHAIARVEARGNYISTRTVSLPRIPGDRNDPAVSATGDGFVQKKLAF